jgi:hypothetical protein
VKEFQSLAKHGNLRRKVSLDSMSSENSQDNVTLHSTWGVTVKATRRTVTTTKVWGTVRWRPVKDSPFAQDLHKLTTFNKAAREVLDLEPLDAETVWQSIPFTWLADYFTGISDFLIANTGRNSVEPYDICIMRETTSVDRYQVTDHPSSVRVNGSGKHIRILYQRDVCDRGDFPAAPAELLNESQWKPVVALFLVLGQKLR